MPWTAADIPDLTDRTFVVTGANSGLGWEAARMLAARGGRVVMACRNLEKGQVALDRIRTAAPAARLELVKLDLGSLASIRACAAELSARLPAVDVLVNNAGIMAIPRSLTEDGFETQIGTNHLGHFALTGLLLDRIVAGKAPRVVNVTSAAHRFGTMHFDDLFGERRYRKWEAYGQSKLANLLFTFELQRRLAARHPGVLTAACHPGYASTNLQAVGPAQEGSAVGAWFMRVGNGLFAQSAEMGALPTVYAATAPDVHGGDVIGPDGLLEVWGHPRKVDTNAASKDTAAAARLWEMSERLTGVGWLS
jgi:NAD(P)-dependent dehydrogenase (short-subunit alcohol dehydrogenase family)